LEVKKMVKIQIDEKAKNFIRQKNADAVTVKLERYGGG
jgi:hypothetical protein